nr:4Fe-4S binding protein [Sagittula salina]
MGSQSIDAGALSRTTGLDVRPPCSALCTREVAVAAEGLTQGDVVFACTQESAVFEALADELGVAPPALVDLRDRAGWSADEAPKLPKMSALVAEAMLPAAPEKSLDVVSEGLCLIVGAPEVALAAAESLKDHLGVTVLLPEGAEVPDTRDYDIVTGRMRRATGALGRFDLVIDALRTVEPGGRGSYALTAPKDGARSDCDILLDLRGEAPLFPAHEKRDGYLRADPKRPEAVSAAVLAASHMVGTFEKVLHVRTEPLLCAHSRAGQVGCTRCLDLCPTGAITPNGEHVTVDPLICAGCGACSAACPSGAISYDAPPVDLVMRRVQVLATAYRDAGGHAPRLLVHERHGAEMIRLSARHGRGLPSDVIPMEVPKVGVFGHAEMVAALGAGFASVALLPGPGADMAAITAQVTMARAIRDAVTVIDTPDPDVLSDALYAAQAPAPLATPVRPMGTRRQITRQAARALHPEGGALALPVGAPYGAVLVDQDACTLCLSCVSLCPSGALGDNPDRPELRFQEDACLQCGICATACPENAITLEPRLDLSEAALRQRVLKEEEPFACVECGGLFGVKSTVERITQKLSSHAMFSGEKLRMIQMCDDCRVNAQFHSDDSPFAGKQRPRPRTTEDYLKRRDN